MPDALRGSDRGRKRLSGYRATARPVQYGAQPLAERDGGILSQGTIKISWVTEAPPGAWPVIQARVAGALLTVIR